MTLFNQKKWYAVVSFVLFLGMMGCDSNINSPKSSAANGPSATHSQANISKADWTKAEKKAKKLVKFAKENGYDLNAASKFVKKKLSSTTSDVNRYSNFLKVVNGDQYKCGPTELNDWASENLVYANLSDALIIILSGVDQYPFLYTLLFVNKRDQPFQSFGYDGEYTRQVRRANRGFNRFWRGVNLRPVEVLGAHGRILSDFNKVNRLVNVLYPNDSEESNAQFAHLIVDFIKASPGVYNGGDAPLFSFNAVAYQGGAAIINGEPSPPKVLMGDGILAGLDAVGQGDAAPQAIVSHELSHQIQYVLGNVFGNGPDDPVKATRRTELMADAFAGYYLGHKRGAAFNWGRVKSFMQSDFDVGDCAFESPSHHGTPNQRVKAGKFGFDLANSARRRVAIISAGDFVKKFDAALPEITAPDSASAKTN